MRLKNIKLRTKLASLRFPTKLYRDSYEVINYIDRLSIVFVIPQESRLILFYTIVIRASNTPTKDVKIPLFRRGGKNSLNF
ncbi:hypothetical protein EMIT036CA2_11149 [Chryseobacterium sp. IT-36CA2]